MKKVSLHRPYVLLLLLNFLVAMFLFHFISDSYTFQNEAQLVDDGMAMIGFQSNSQKFGSSEDDFIDSDDARTGRPRVRAARSSPFAEPKILVIPRSHMKRGRALPHRWSYRRVCDL